MRLAIEIPVAVFCLGFLPLHAQAPADLLRAQVIRTRGESELGLGQYAQAADHGAECAALFQGLQAPEGEAVCWGIAGQAEVYRARYPEAVAAFEKSVGVARAHQLVFSQTATLNDLGNVRYFMGSYAEANSLYEEAAKLVAANKQADWAPRLGQLTQANLAVLYQRLGQYERALTIYRQMEKASTLPPAQHAQMLSNIGVLYRRLGDPYKAMSQYTEAAALLRKNRERDSEIGIVKNTGIVLAMDLQDFAKAEKAFESALDLATATGNRREIAQAHLYLAETLRRMHRLDGASEQAKKALAVATEIKSTEDSWKAIYTLGRVAEDREAYPEALERYTEAIAQVESIRTGLGTTSLRASFLGDKRNVYDGAIRVRLRGASPNGAEMFRLMEASRARSFQDKSGGTTLQEVAARIPSGTALLEYWVSGTQGGVLWIAGGRFGTRRFMVPEESAIAALTSALREGSPSWKQTATAIGDAILGVVSDLPGTTTRLAIVLDGGLAAIPFEALPAGGKLLIERYAISYLPSASLAIHAAESPGWRGPWSRVVTAFADPVYGTAPAGSLYAAELVPLAGARQEAIDVAAIVGGKRDLHIGVDDRKSYVAPANQAPAPVLHFATHAIADLEDADRSRLVFSSATANGPADFLFAKEIAALNLHGTRLVTLAACDTETGQTLAGEGVLSLSRAFLTAGSDATISTLWRVGDQSSAELMRRFYRHLADGDPAVEALRKAKLEFLAADGGLAHPRYWAAFVLNGDSAMRLPRRIPVVPAATALVVLGCAAWFVWLRFRTRTA